MNFSTLNDAKGFALGGNALFTLESRKTWKHHTYKVRLAKDKKDFYFVTYLAHGSADEGDFAYLGIIAGGQFRLTKNSKASAESEVAKAFGWFWALKGPEMPNQLIVHHEGKCGKCGRTLTVPESISSGIGPECLKKMSKPEPKLEHHTLHTAEVDGMGDDYAE